MAEFSFPFPSVNGDRKYGAGDWANYFGFIMTNGVFPVGNQLQVTPGGGMQVFVSPGKAWINGYGYNNTTDFTLS
ncbi:MAG: hypothetical protein FWG45_07050, partial [Oscillospiraceae bacterium]|nr:hypothetical protein [Oscillospiraceae bacterium]